MSKGIGSDLPEGFSYDLKPEEPKKADPSGPPAEMPTGPLPPSLEPPGPNDGPDPHRPPLKARKEGPRGAAAGGGSEGKGKLIGLGVGGLVLVLILFLTLRPSKVPVKISGRSNFDATITVSAGSARIENLDVKGGAADYTFDVDAIDGNVLVGVAKRSPRDPITPAVLKKLPGGLQPATKGGGKSLSGTLEPGTWSWIVLNESKTPVKAKVKFKAAGN